MNLGALVKQAMNAVPSDLKMTLTLTLKSPGVHNASQGTFTGQTITTATGVVSQEKAYTNRYVKLNLIERKAQTLLFVPNTSADIPLMAMTVPWNGEDFLVANIIPIAPRGVPVAYFLDIAL